MLLRQNFITQILIKFRGRRMDSPSGERDFVTFHNSESLRNVILCSTEIPLRHGYLGTRLPSKSLIRVEAGIKPEFLDRVIPIRSAISPSSCDGSEGKHITRLEVFPVTLME
jgi:hypothetical protein